MCGFIQICKIQRPTLIEVVQYQRSQPMPHRLCLADAIFISGDCRALFCKAFVIDKNKAILCDSSGEVNLLMDRTYLKLLVKY